jgi:hypothetical protein
MTPNTRLNDLTPSPRKVWIGRLGSSLGFAAVGAATGVVFLLVVAIFVWAAAGIPVGPTDRWPPQRGKDDWKIIALVLGSITVVIVGHLSAGLAGILVGGAVIGGTLGAILGWRLQKWYETQAERNSRKAHAEDPGTTGPLFPPPS